MNSRCEYCARSQAFELHNGQCASCGAPLPKPEPRVVEYSRRLNRAEFDVTTFDGDCTKYVLGPLYGMEVLRMELP